MGGALCVALDYKEQNKHVIANINHKATAISGSQMLIFNFITQEEIDDLPNDDPQLAFARFVEISQRRLSETIRDTENDESGWHTRNEAEHGFMNVVIAAAKRFEIEPLASVVVPRATKHDSDTYREFRSDLDHYLTQLLLGNSAHAKRDSVLIPSELKTTIRTYVFHLREVIENNTDLDVSKRKKLLGHLADFENALENKRLNLLSVTVLAITLLGAPGALLASGEPAYRLLANILRAVGEAKVADDAIRQLPSAAAPLVLTAPRPSENPRSNFSKSSSTVDFDDEIPF